MGKNGAIYISKQETDSHIIGERYQIKVFFVCDFPGMIERRGGL